MKIYKRSEIKQLSIKRKFSVEPFGGMGLLSKSKAAGLFAAAILTLAAISLASSTEAFASSVKVSSTTNSGTYSYIVFDPLCGVSGPLTVNENILKHHFVLYSDGSYEDSYLIHSAILASDGSQIATSATESKIVTGTTESLPIESLISQVVKCGAYSAEPGQVSSQHMIVTIGPDGSIKTITS